MNLLDDIDKAYRFAKQHECCENDCSLNLGSLSNYTILKGEKLARSMRKHTKMCDCLIFISKNKLIILLVELKHTTNLDDTEISGKFETGVAIVNQVLKEQKVSQTPKIFPILLSKSLSSSLATYALVTNIRVCINGQKKSLRCKECNCSLNDILPQLWHLYK